MTARLSRKFYERFGDDLTNELVEGFNQVDATYRSELREINDLNWARFEAKLEQRIAELRTDLAHLETKLIRWMFLFWVTNIADFAKMNEVYATYFPKDPPARSTVAGSGRAPSASPLPATVERAGGSLGK